ncbi:hypothetical protein C2W62_53815, partial [Candidatus Entotheonella serta]
MLDLKRLYWNCRVFREGKRKRRSPYELLGLQLPTSDWWELLHLGDVAMVLSKKRRNAGPNQVRLFVTTFQEGKASAVLSLYAW